MHGVFNSRRHVFGRMFQAEEGLECLTNDVRISVTTTPPQPFYGPFSGTTWVSQCQKRTSGLYGARED